MSKLSAERELEVMDMNGMTVVGFLRQAAEAGKSNREILQILADTADVACDKYAKDAEVVRRSVEGVSHLTPGAGEFEMHISDKLSELAEQLQKS